MRGEGIDWLTAAKLYGCGSLHRRLSDLRNGEYDGFNWPIDFGKWQERNGKRFKSYMMDLDKVPKKI